MKMMLITLATLVSASALACPTFNGAYLCKGDGLEQTLNVKTEVVDGVHKYSLDDTSVLADGQYRKVNFQGGEYDMAATCKDQNLTVNIKFGGGEGDHPDCGPQKWDLIYSLSFSQNETGINETHGGQAQCADGKTYPTEDMNGSMTCVLK
ncbi:MAG: hypothetical protein ACAH59_05880 [Pseudobdellovibrionaceae bacterium]